MSWRLEDDACWALKDVPGPTKRRLERERNQAEGLACGSRGTRVEARQRKFETSMTGYTKKRCCTASHEAVTETVARPTQLLWIYAWFWSFPRRNKEACLGVCNRGLVWPEEGLHCISEKVPKDRKDKASTLVSRLHWGRRDWGWPLLDLGGGQWRRSGRRTFQRCLLGKKYRAWWAVIGEAVEKKRCPRWFLELCSRWFQSSWLFQQYIHRQQYVC